jgi:hypothetical protein
MPCKRLMIDQPSGQSRLGYPQGKFHILIIDPPCGWQMPDELFSQYGIGLL